MLERPVFSKKNGYHLGYGWCGGPCRWGTKLKTRALDGLSLDAEKHYIGITADEPERLAKLKAPKCSPLAEAGMTEADCLEYCYQRGFFWEENGVRLYDVLDRVSCWCCKNKKRAESDLSVSPPLLVASEGAAGPDPYSDEAIQPQRSFLRQCIRFRKSL